ncbi:MAG TPA: HAMP domain-containing sensor histidine kinase [Nocardioidaceae bacterium]|nr:HAMP domain-containing sensor histidine kinase [Nocardioidaceae bacterium]
MRRRLQSLRARLALINVGLLAVALLVAACVSVVGLKTYLMDRIDDDLHSMQAGFEHTDLSAASLRELAQRGGALAKLDSAARESGSSGLIGALVSPDGAVLPVYGAGSVGEQEALAAAVDDPQELADSGNIVDVDINDEHFRTAASRLNDGTVVLGASSTETVDVSIRRLIHIELVVGIALLVLLATISLATARRRLRPLEDMVETASAIAEGDMSRRVSDRGPTSTEVEQLRTALNAMLHQIETAFQTRERLNAQLRNFAADASHELRTPLATIQGYLQLYEKGMLSGDEAELARERIVAETERMAHLVDQLLALARLDQQPEIRSQPVDLADLARDAAGDLAVVQPDRVVRLEIPETPVLVRADEAQLRQLVGNLLTNVRMHTPVDAEVTVSVTESGVLRVADAGPGMPPADAARVFDRFFRVGTERPAGAGGSGLGLSIVHAVVVAHGGTIELDTEPGAGVVMTVTLPVAAQPARVPSAAARD